MTPQVYSEESRDFQLLCKIGDFAFNEVKYETDSITNIINTDKIKDNILPLLQTKVGFFSNTTSLTSDELRLVLKIFPYIVKLKGSDLALKYILNACLKLYNISANFQIEKVTSETKVGNVIFDNHSILIGINKIINITNIIQELIKYVMPPGYKIYIYYYSDIPLSSSYVFKDYIDLIVSSDNINSNVRHFSTFNTFYGESSGNTPADNKNYYAYDYEYNTIGMIDVIKVASGYDNIAGWVATNKDHKFWGVYKSERTYPTSPSKGDILINSLLGKIYYFYNSKWNPMHYYGIRKSLNSTFDPVDFGVYGLKNDGSKLYYRYDDQTKDWVKLNYRGQAATKFISNPQNNDFVRLTTGNKYYFNGSWLDLGKDLGILDKKPQTSNANDFMYLSEIRYYIRINGKDIDFTDSFYELVYQTTNDAETPTGILGIGVLGNFVLGGPL